MPTGVSYKRIDSITDFGAKKEVVLAVEETPDTPAILATVVSLPSSSRVSSAVPPYLAFTLATHNTQHI